MFWVNGVFKWNNLAVQFKLTLDMIFVVLHKYLNCAPDKTIDAGHTASTDCNRTILLIMLSITSWCKPLKADPSREICTYPIWLKPSFVK